MADTHPTSHDRPRRRLGIGLGSLIPTSPVEDAQPAARPLDVLFPGSTKASGSSRASDATTAGPTSTASDATKSSGTTKSSGASNSSGASRSARGTRVVGSSKASGASEAAENSPSLENTVSSQGGAVGRRAGAARAQVRSATSVGSTAGTAASTKGRRNVSRETSQFSTPRTAALQTERSSERATSRAVNALMSATIVSRETSEADDVDLVEVPGARFAQLSIAHIIPNSRQPREVFAEEELAELSASITEVGVLQPVVVRPLSPSDEPTERLRELLEAKPEARYELIMGERRMRASELAGLSTIPAIIRDTEDDDLLRDALLENLHRVQLNPLEEASAYQQLMADFGATQEELSKRIARSRSQIANTIRLLNLPSAVQMKLAAGTISAGHARALLGFDNPADMEYLADRIVAEGLSVRTTEELVRLRIPRHQVGTKGPRVKEVSALGQSVIGRLQDVLDTRVTIAEGRKKGKIVIEFAGEDDLQRLADMLLK